MIDSKNAHFSFWILKKCLHRTSPRKWDIAEVCKQRFIFWSNLNKFSNRWKAFHPNKSRVVRRCEYCVGEATPRINFAKMPAHEICSFSGGQHRFHLENIFSHMSVKQYNPYINTHYLTTKVMETFGSIEYQLSFGKWRKF